MADRRIGKDLPKWADRENTPGERIDAGPYLGVVKNNVDPARLGRLQVWIKELGGEELEPSTWNTVSYASPFLGSTRGIPGSPDAGNFGTEQQAYGFWAVPPDIGNWVLVTFVEGNPNRGYWFACVPSTTSLNMIPAIARPSIANRIITDTPAFKDRVDSNSFLPASEVNLDAPGVDKDPNFLNSPRAIHNFQANIVIQQGLDIDEHRGTVTSSSQRDTPSRVIGISSPGRTSPDETDFPNFKELLSAGELTIEQFQSYWVTRKGGHSFVMDDGDIYGENNLVRLRSAGGHTILMNDTQDIFYIINKTGSAWVELTSDGSINVYGQNDINIRAEHNLNLHADANVNIHAGDTIRFFAGSSILSQTKVQLTTVDDLYNINSGIMGIRVGGKLDMRSTVGSWETAGDLNIKTGKTFLNSKDKTTITSGATSGWNVTSGELWYSGDKIYLNTDGKKVETPEPPISPEINPALDLYKQPSPVYDTTVNRWFIQKDQFESVSPFTPTHEPWKRETGVKKFADGSVENPKQQGKM